MSTKDCPSCGAEVPAEAPRCKHCFHDFTEAPPRKGINGLVGLLVMLAAMAAIGAGTFWFVGQRQAQERVVVDKETRSVIFTTTSSTGTTTDRLSFDDITKVEVIMGGSKATWEVVVVTTDDERRTIELSKDKSLKGYAEHVSHVMDKPLVEKSLARGFGERVDQDKD